ncbi:IS3 family transposase [Streptomyces sp. NPDC087851]|uniref:IS3 family transposase n=1 Tax=Streptomyces sp. NPDC087851 TaxID=3365810 RepID=UPI00381FFEE3
MKTELKRANEILKAASVVCAQEIASPERGRGSGRPPAPQGPRGRSRLPGAGPVAVDVLRAQDARSRPTACTTRNRSCGSQTRERTDGAYGARRITRTPLRAGHTVACRTIERLMREPCIKGVIRRQRRPHHDPGTGRAGNRQRCVRLQRRGGPD